MSYRGKPSRSCDKCRTRKVKCDEGKPECARCIKSGESCRYRPDHVLFFRDQSKDTAEKANAKWRSRSAKAASSQQLMRVGSTAGTEPYISSFELPFVNNILPPRVSSFVSSPPPFLDLPKRDVAINLFFQDYVLPGSNTNPDEGYLDFLPDLYAKASENSCLKWAVSAVAMAHMGNTQRLPDMKEDAARDYNKALHLSMSALVSEEAAKMTDTLLAVYLLVFYENITCAEAGSSTWSAHVAGAVSIVMLRGEKQFKSIIGMKLFRVIHTHMLVAALCQRKHPQLPIQMWTDNYKTSPTTACLMTLLYRTAVLRAEAYEQLSPKYGIPAPREKVEEILNKALAIEEGYQTWSEIAPLNYQYQVVPRSEFTHIKDNPLHAEGKPKTVHIYADGRASSHWNLFRAARVFLTQTIVSCCKQLNEYPSSPPHSPPRFTADLDAILKKTIRCSFEAADSICASVDTVLYLPNTPSDFNRGIHNFPPDIPKDKQKATAGALRGYSLMFPLWVSLLAYEATLFSPLAAQTFPSGFGEQESEGKKTGFKMSMFETAYMRCEWIKGILLYIHNTLGISQAGAIGRKSMQEGRQLGWRW